MLAFSAFIAVFLRRVESFVLTDTSHGMALARYCGGTLSSDLALRRKSHCPASLMENQQSIPETNRRPLRSIAYLLKLIELLKQTC